MKDMTGMQTLGALVNHLDRKLGAAPTPEAIAVAFTRLVESYYPRVMRDSHVTLATRAYKYLRAQGLLLEPPVLRKALGSLQGQSPKQLVLAREVWKDLVGTEGVTASGDDVYYYAVALSAAGSPEEAVEVAKRWAGGLEDGIRRKVWEKVLEGLGKKGKEQVLMDTVEHLLAKETGAAAASLYYHPVVYYCKRDDLENAKLWYDRAVAVLSDGGGNTIRVYLSLLKACLRSGQFEWGSEVLGTLLETHAKDPNIKLGAGAWDTVLEFTARTSKGTDEVNRLLDIMVSRAGNTGLQPSADTINNILETAISLNSHEMVDKILPIFPERGIEPNRTSFELQLKSLTLRGDYDGAMAVFENLKFTHDVPKNYTGDVPQDLMRAVAERYPDCDLPRLVALYKDLVEMKIHLNCATLIAILNVHLEEVAFAGARDLLKREVGFFSAAERESVIQKIIEFTHRESTPSDNAWEAYLLLIRVFPETSVKDRGRMMKLFFELGKPVAAVRVLEHMTRTEDRKPSKSEYTAAFVGIGQAQSVDNIQPAHRLLNMDPYVELDTTLLNALMYAYIRCGMTERAFFVYEEIARSREGPDNTTISHVFDACGRSHRGFTKTQALWSRYIRQGVKLTEDNVAAYIEALARLERWDEASKVVANLEGTLGFKAGHKMLVSSHLPAHLLY